MKDFLVSSVFFGVFMSLVGYEVGVFLKRKLKLAIFNPLLISILFVIGALLLLPVDYAAYNESAQTLSYFITPATICLAIPLYQQFALLKKNWKAIIGGVVAGVLSSMVSILALSYLFGLNHQQYVTLLPKSITTAIAMGVSEELGGIVTITVAAIMITGILGNILAEAIYKLFHIDEPVAKGLALGASAHAFGTVKALEMGEVEGAMSSLAIALCGLLTVVAANLFAAFL